jgi:hypothetical protein
MIAQRVPVETGQPTAHALRPGYRCSARDCLCGSKSRRAAETDCVAGVMACQIRLVYNATFPTYGVVGESSDC